MKEKKVILLVVGVLMDAIGMLSYLFPIVGEVSDFVWAPVSAWIMTKMYKGIGGKVAAFVSMMEEVLTFDFVPTFTLMWIYTYVIKSEDKDKDRGRMIPIRVRS